MASTEDFSTLPVICSWCRRRRDPQDSSRWLSAQPGHQVATHGICPACHQAIIDDIRNGELLGPGGVKAEGTGRP